MDWSVVADNHDVLLRGLANTLMLAALTVGVSVVLAIPLALLREVRLRAIRYLVAAFSWITRAVPALVLLYFSYYGLPFVGVRLDPLPAAVIGLTLSAAGYNMEFFRAGFRSVGRGQLEAARALGLPYRRTLRRIILPQALRVTIPPLFSNLTLVLKGTSLAGLVCVGELTGAGNTLISFFYQPIEILIAVAAAYLLLNSILVLIQRQMEKACQIEHRSAS